MENESTSYYTSVIQSPQFTFLVGKGQTPMTIHAGIVKGKSDALSAMIGNGLMKESATGVAVLDDVDVDVFGGFCEHLYTGSYTTPKCTTNTFGGNSQVKAQRVQGRTTSGGNPVPASNRRSMDQYVIPNHPNVKDCRQVFLEFYSLKFGGNPASANSNPDILFHAKLYVLATRFLVDPLRLQCLKSLHRDLLNIISETSDLLLVVDLLNFTYNNTGPSEPGGGSPLRKLVSHYAACKVSIPGGPYDRLFRLKRSIRPDILDRLLWYRQEQ